MEHEALACYAMGLLAASCIALGKVCVTDLFSSTHDSTTPERTGDPAFPPLRVGLHVCTSLLEGLHMPNEYSSKMASSGEAYNV